MRLLKPFIYLVLFFSTWFSFSTRGQNFPDPGNPPRLVHDLADILSPEEEKALERKLVAWEDSTSNQLAVVLLSSLEGYPVEDYANRLFDKWGIGTKDKKNGVLILVSMEDRKTRIEVGYGLEGAITDLTSKRILDEDIKPLFRAKAYYEALDRASSHIIDAAKGEYKGNPAKVGKRQKKGRKSGFWILLGIVFLIILLSRGRGGNGGGFLTGMLLGSLLNSGNRGSSWGDFSSGGGSFGGFGGGSSGGGGASGDW